MQTCFKDYLVTKSNDNLLGLLNCGAAFQMFKKERAQETRCHSTSRLAWGSLLVCLFGAYRRINPCGSLASDGIKLNMMKIEKVKIYKIK